MAVKNPEAFDLKLLRIIADGKRTLPEMKTKLRGKDPKARVTALVKDDSLRKDDEGRYILTRKGAGRLRFAA